MFSPLCKPACFCEAEDEPALLSTVVIAAAPAADSLESSISNEPSTSPTTLSFAQVVTLLLISLTCCSKSVHFSLQKISNKGNRCGNLAHFAEYRNNAFTLQLIIFR